MGPTLRYAFTVALTLALWILARPAWAGVSVTLSKGVQDAIAKSPAAATKPTQAQIDKAINDALGDIVNEKAPAKETKQAKTKRERDAAIAKALIDSGMSIVIMCREEAKGVKGLEEVYGDSEPNVIGGGGAATKGDFDAKGKPKKKGKVVIVIECGFINGYGIFGAREKQASVIAMIGHELVHAADATYRHKPEDPNADTYNEFRDRFMPYFDRSYRRQKREKDKRRGKETSMAPSEHGAYVAVSPGLIHVELQSGAVGYQWGAQGGYLLRGPGIFAAGVGASFEHALSTAASGTDRFTNHLLRVQGEVTPGAMLVGGDLFVHGNLAFGYGPAVSSIRTAMDTIRATNHGFVVSVGAGASYRVWRGLTVGLDAGVDLGWLVSSGALAAAHTFDLEAVAGWWF